MATQKIITLRLDLERVASIKRALNSVLDFVAAFNHLRMAALEIKFLLGLLEGASIAANTDVPPSPPATETRGSQRETTAATGQKDDAAWRISHGCPDYYQRAKTEINKRVLLTDSFPPPPDDFSGSAGQSFSESTSPHKQQDIGGESGGA